MVSSAELRTFSHSIRPLLSFSDDDEAHEGSIPMSLHDYMTLVDLTGRVTRLGKRGAISAKMSPILERLKLSESAWLDGATGFESMHSRRQPIGATAAKIA